jgi:hypothetical protein
VDEEFADFDDVVGLSVCVRVIFEVHPVPVLEPEYARHLAHTLGARQTERVSRVRDGQVCAVCVCTFGSKDRIAEIGLTCIAVIVLYSSVNEFASRLAVKLPADSDNGASRARMGLKHGAGAAELVVGLRLDIHIPFTHWVAPLPSVVRTGDAFMGRSTGGRSRCLLRFRLPTLVPPVLAGMLRCMRSGSLQKAGACTLLQAHGGQGALHYDSSI